MGGGAEEASDTGTPKGRARCGQDQAVISKWKRGPKIMRRYVYLNYYMQHDELRDIVSDLPV